MGGRTWLAATLLVALGCGRSSPFFPPPDFRDCEDRGDSSVGCAFVVGPSLGLVDPASEIQSVPPAGRSPDGVFVVNPSEHDIVTIQAHEIAWGETESIEYSDPLPLLPGERRLIKLPSTAQRERTDRRRGDLLQIIADAPVVASMHGPYRPFLGNDSALLLPQAAHGQRYVVASYYPHTAHFQGLGVPTFFEVVAQHDDTVVRWRPKTTATEGDDATIPAVNAGQWSPEVRLGRHEVVLVTALPGQPGSNGDVSGTLIEASAPIAVTSGSRCSAVPGNAAPGAGCDPLVEQLVPVRAWGSRVVVPHPPLRTTEAHHVRIYAGAPDITVTTDPMALGLPPPSTLADTGDFIEVTVPHGTSFVADATGPIMVVSYLQSRDDDIELGDPAMTQLAATAQYRRDYTIATGTEWERHFVQAVRLRGGAPVSIDGTALVGWEPIGADYELSTTEITEGAHRLQSNDPFGLTQLGWNNRLHPGCTNYATHGTCQTSYAHPGGLTLPGR